MNWAATGEALDINDSSQVVGFSDTSTGTRAFLWDSQNGMMDLGDLAGGANFSRAFGINSLGQVVGDSGPGSGGHAFLWDSQNGMMDLGELPGGPNNSRAFDINDSGQVIGLSLVGAGEHAFLWDALNGMQDLNDLIDPNDPLFGFTTLTVARHINNAGQIVGYGSINDVTHGILLTPVPEPTTLAILGLGLAGLGVVRRKRRTT